MPISHLLLCSNLLRPFDSWLWKNSVLSWNIKGVKGVKGVKENSILSNPI